MNAPHSTAELIASLRQVANDAEALLRASSDSIDEQTVGLRTRVTESLTMARQRLRRVEEKVADRTRITALETDLYVRRNPWKALAIASSVALVVGVLLPEILRRGAGRRRKE